ncbi:Phytanoyl-CoA dioxygenase (PhyH) [Seminavis robusta]|uniref:Phytanoyl-CoA dioxygenase (PhyH) n=1 Tax=Seminavis robusta TaxID=568900 RepID=A0A9N8DIB9_9STRA|nr:Phytanoyl-CoA dioxygenase (PhyH) [Seminavis robusta]|eukprot:Sro104_g052870.1 Phytanoyl-CoA dioxygenase (PhyH) (375) ;mRNA; r:66238-67362
MTSQKKYCDKRLPCGSDDEIQAAFREDGFVVVTNVLTPNEVTAILDELWMSPRLLGRPGIERGDPSTWGSGEWPQQQSVGGRNFVNSADVFQDAASWDLTSHEKLVRLQKMLYGREDIMSANLGRWGVMRPTVDHPEWKTDESWLHWDQNPWTEPSFVRLQAIVCLTDNTEKSGGFACVPGFHRSFEQWGKEHPMGSVLVGGRKADRTYGVNQPFVLPKDDPCQQRVVRVLAPAGSVVVWDSRLPHQNFPNTDERAMRVVHYTMMKPRDEESAREHRELLEQKMVVMEVLGITGERFPAFLTETAREVHCLGTDSIDAVCDRLHVDESLREAIPLVYEAGEAEERGEVHVAIKKHQKALRLYPEIEHWYSAILR